MEKFQAFTSLHKLDCDGLIGNLRRAGTPERVYFIELFLDKGIRDAVEARFNLVRDDKPDQFSDLRQIMAVNRFLGYETVQCSLLALNCGPGLSADDTSALKQWSGQRSWQDEHRGPIASWEDFEKYPWPDGRTWNTERLEWLEKNLPDDMCIRFFGGHFCEYLCWLMGYETLCFALADQRDLVRAIADRILELEVAQAKIALQFKRVKLFWGSDDMGFKTGLMISPADMREFVLSGHKRLAAMAHAAGRPYLLHACGKRGDIIEDLIEDVKIDAVHSWEDTIESIIDAKRAYGGRLSLLGGLDVDFLCKASEAEVRRRTRSVVEACQPGGGFCLGTGNSVANYIPLDNYLAMLDEGRQWRG